MLLNTWCNIHHYLSLSIQLIDLFIFTFVISSVASDLFEFLSILK